MLYSNEVLALLFMAVYMLSAVFFYKLGRTWIQNFVIISYVITLSITTKFFSFFGLTASVGVVTYAGLFLATDMLTERYGKKAGFETVRLAFVMAFVYVAITQMALFFSPLPFSKEASDAMDVIYGSSVRVMLAGAVAYLFAQHFDVWFYHFLHEKTKGRHLWLRNNGSTLVSQFLDTILFFTLAFYGTMPFNAFLETLLVGFALKACIAIFDTPFMYLARRVTPLDQQQNKIESNTPQIS